jgi:hypothetical protein
MQEYIHGMDVIICKINTAAFKKSFAGQAGGTPGYLMKGSALSR